MLSDTSQRPLPAGPCLARPATPRRPRRPSRQHLVVPAAAPPGRAADGPGVLLTTLECVETPPSFPSGQRHQGPGGEADSLWGPRVRRSGGSRWMSEEGRGRAAHAEAAHDSPAVSVTRTRVFTRRLPLLRRRERGTRALGCRRHTGPAGERAGRAPGAAPREFSSDP